MGCPYERNSECCTCRKNGREISEGIYNQYCIYTSCEDCPIKPENDSFEFRHYYHGELYEDRRE